VKGIPKQFSINTNGLYTSSPSLGTNDSSTLYSEKNKFLIEVITFNVNFLFIINLYIILNIYLLNDFF